MALLPRPCGEAASGGAPGWEQKFIQINKCGGGGGSNECPFPGGLPGQVLTKAGFNDCDAEWRDFDARPAIASSLDNTMHIITQEDLDNGFFDIRDCINIQRLEDTTVHVNTDTYYYMFDYEVIQDQFGDWRRIQFNQGLIDLPIRLNDRIWIFFHHGECDMIAPPPPVAFWEVINGIGGVGGVGALGTPITILNGMPGPFTSLNGTIFFS